ncbi:putative guanine nucleotide exchange factor [Blattamonas nauphoetae]|uniref:Guanine nucleotide exchange factor n=1 Tax=Blattamonas nauphoetae TaxID=2049346 RepID=A0ABQ9YEI3_9EUKA|nr:putative guanine nucleotide exchange factor [Blattamonas nauphoetae]
MSIDPSLISESNLNTKSVKCKDCGDLILRKNVGTFIKKDIYLPKYNSRRPEDGEVESDFWFLNNMMKFDNIGFSKMVQGNDKTATSIVTPSPPEATGVVDPQNATNPTLHHQHVRYLTCCACDRGPVGVQLTPQEFYIDAKRVAYD